MNYSTSFHTALFIFDTMHSGGGGIVNGMRWVRALEWDYRINLHISFLYVLLFLYDIFRKVEYFRMAFQNYVAILHQD